MGQSVSTPWVGDQNMTPLFGNDTPTCWWWRLEKQPFGRVQHQRTRVHLTLQLLHLKGSSFCFSKNQSGCLIDCELTDCQWFGCVLRAFTFFCRRTRGIHEILKWKDSFQAGGRCRLEPVRLSFLRFYSWGHKYQKPSCALWWKLSRAGHRQKPFSTLVHACPTAFFLFVFFQVSA